MITNTILIVFLAFCGFILSPILSSPDVTLPPDMTFAWGAVSGALANMNIVFPMGTLFAMLGIVIAIELAILTYKAIYWLIKKIPTIS